MNKVSLMLILACILAASSLVAKNSLALLPITTAGIDGVNTNTFEQLLRQEILNSTDYQIISRDLTIEISGYDYCMDAQCGSDIGRSLNVDKVVSCSLSKLGKKIVVQFMKVDVPTGTIDIIDSVVSASLDDLDTVAKRIALSIDTDKEITATAQVGSVLKKEENITRRKARRYSGLAFGYLYPTNGYDNLDDNFILDGKLGFETERMEVGMLSGYRRGFIINIFTHYLLTKTDFCPYIGGALGFHWIYHDYRIDEYNEDGFEITASTGLKLFRTYNFQISINCDYSISLNDYDDQALSITLGLLK